jgi:hypothetical protein
MSDPICKQCGKKVPLYKADYAFGDGTKWQRKGQRAAGHMQFIDPNNHFCTMRCAARFAVSVIENNPPRRTK